MKININYIYIFFLLFSCTQEVKIVKKDIKINEPTYYSKGFALIYEDSTLEDKIVNNKLNNDQSYVFQNTIDNDRLVSITNPLNSKFIIAKVKKNTSYPLIYKVVITKKMAENLNLDINNPYVEILTIKDNDKFIAKEASIFEEEKNVANKAPVESIDINDLSSSTVKNTKKIKKVENIKKKPSYIIDIADFYYYESAKTVINRFKNEANLLNFKIKKLSQNKFKVYAGPYDTFDSMKKTHLALTKLGFENIDVTNINK